MFGIRLPVRRAGKDEAEKPFWISFSDMMTALMVLFLVAMTVALLAVTNDISAAEREKSQREKEIAELLKRIEESSKMFPGIKIRGHSIDFGERARFETDSNKLTSEQGKLLRSFAPAILSVARDPMGQKWLKRVIVEGFADKRGTYLHNLNLSMQRSERVLCAFMARPENDETTLSDSDRRLIREIFLVGGSSFNSLKSTMEESRRIELKLEFLDIGEKRALSPNLTLADEPMCPLDCP
ncbi:flagellar motor protein MotB [Citrifermentans bremense]|uniref:flagellar motor protein MotB n=1 Tax=Citrifermentans bremense TaxID=60035 RepID=UPI0004105222|nr:flagellar motor protein MotB [Citrifermentans bremense]